MGFKCGLIGLPNVGKSTIFNALTRLSVPAENYPFCTVEPNVGMVALEDSQLVRIGEIIGSAKSTPTVLEFIDIAGLVKGASQGEGLGNQFLSHIQRVDALVHVVRCFDAPDVVRQPASTADPIADVQTVNLELILKDLEWVEARLEKSETAARTGEKTARREYETLLRFQQHLLAERELRSLVLDESELPLLRQMNLLTAKPVVYLANTSEKASPDQPGVRELAAFAAANGAALVVVPGKIMAEIAELDPADQRVFMEELGLHESGLQALVRAGFTALNLITFYTANENEARAWTIRQGARAIDAAGQVHSDFRDKFICAEIMRPEALLAAGSEAKLRGQGRIAIQGRDYVVQDGDILLFRIGR